MYYDTAWFVGQIAFSQQENHLKVCNLVQPISNYFEQICVHTCLNEQENMPVSTTNKPCVKTLNKSHPGNQ